MPCLVVYATCPLASWCVGPENKTERDMGFESINQSSHTRWQEKISKNQKRYPETDRARQIE